MEVKVNFISQEKLNGLALNDKLAFILTEIKNGKILVLERGLKAEEQTQCESSHNVFDFSWESITQQIVNLLSIGAFVIMTNR